MCSRTDVASVHLLSTRQVAIFEQYASCVFLPYIMQQLDTFTSVLELMRSGTGTSVIAATSEKQCKGVRMKVAGKNKVDCFFT